MDEAVREAIRRAVEKECFARNMRMELVELELGRSVVAMDFDPGTMTKIYDRAHGGAIFGLIDEAFETASQPHGTIAVALNVNVTDVSSPRAGSRLGAEAGETSLTKKTAGYDIRVTDREGQVMASCQALAYRTGKPIPFLGPQAAP